VGADLLAFALVATLLTVTPGADMALVLGSALSERPGATRRTILGICTGLLAWGAAVAAGIAAVLVASSAAFTALKLAGAVYLIGLGLLVIGRSFASRGGGGLTEPIDLPEGGAPARRPFVRGLTSNLLNPKIAVFYTTLLPQFVEPGGDPFAASLLLAATHATLTLAWLLLFAGVAARARRTLRRPRVRRAIDRLTGTVLVALGVRVALEPR
jgi:threonine/homoserine/homoserine lactone efflux protein